MLASGRIKHGDRVIWNSIFVTEWIPRVPGGLAHMVSLGKSTDALLDNLVRKADATRSYSLIVDDYVPPLGSIRLPVKRGKCIYLGGVTADEYLTDLGVVFCVDEPVYAEFLSRQHDNNAVEATIESFLDLSLQEDASELVEPYIADDHVASMVSGFSRKPFYALRVASPLQSSFRTNSSHPKIHAWTIRRIQHLRELSRVKTNLDESNKFRDAVLTGKKYDFGSTEIISIFSVPKGTIDYEFLSVPMDTPDLSTSQMTRDIIGSCPPFVGCTGGSLGLKLIDEMRKWSAYDHPSLFTMRS